ncbi:MAG: polysaccharide pyruvyl transferase family protein [Candidatus Gastranaerophilales bacterium]|nr:polysaccharide pyruvyl transferase family protein [Candidatus Gastranaerophilales bacterium]
MNTKQRVEDIMGKKMECPLGDPGLLAEKLIDKNIKKECKVGVILHYIDKNSSFIKNIKLDDYKLIDITKNPIYVLNEIAKCEVILSSAMHGLIAADSLDIPNRWIKLSDLLIGGDYKFKDYYSVFNYEPKPIDLRESIITQKEIDDIKSEYEKLNFKDKIKTIKEELLKAGRNI